MGGKVFRKILVGYDGSDGSEKAVALAIELAQRYESTVIVCHAFGHMPMTSKPSEVRRLVNPVVERLSALNISTQIAMPANLLLGSTSERVLRHAKVSVLIAR